MRTEIRILFSNICHVENKKSELEWWLEAQTTTGNTVDAFGMAEPMLINRHADEQFVPQYEFTQTDAESDINTNPHTKTCILYTQSPLRPTITEPNVNKQHKGISWVQKDRRNEAQKDIAYGAAYLPNRSTSNTIEYSMSLVEAIKEQVAEHRARGCVVILAMDANIPFKGPNICAPGSKNLKLLNIILSETQLVVLNWTEMTTGFFTRHRADQKSQLDLMLVDRELLSRVKRLIINRELNFGSDHCVLDLRLHAEHKPNQLQSTRKKRNTSGMKAVMSHTGRK